MGNSASVGSSASGALDSYVSELGEGVVYEKSLGYTRLLKSVKARHANGPLVVKFFIKPDPGLSLRSYNKKLKVERESLADIPNVHSYQVFAETEKAGYLVRQWLASSLYDRISTRPFLTTIEKKWISYQILQGLRDARNRNVSHGDIKSSNILVTSWNWVYIADFATSYKPTYLPLNDPADFSFFFDTSGRRTCYVSPERFYDAAHTSDDPNLNMKEGQVLESMDVFSAGCVIAELWLDGEAVFTLSSMFKYRSGEMNLDALFDRIPDDDVRSLLHGMLKLEPEERPTFDGLLQSSRGTLFPESFYSFLHNYISSVNELPTPSPFAHTRSENTPITIEGPQQQSGSTSKSLPSDSDHRLDRIWNEFDSIESYLFLLSDEDPVDQQLDPQIEYRGNWGNGRPFQDVLPVVLHLANREPQIHGVSAIASSARHPRSSTHDSPALIFLSLVLANLRNATLPSSKLHGMDVLLALSTHLSDDARLDRILPYLIDTLRDDEAIVRLSALRSLVQITLLVTTLTPSNALIFPEYILPNTRQLATDPEVSVRCMFAQLIAPIAEMAIRFLEMSQVLKMHGSFALSDNIDAETKAKEGSYDSNLADIQATIQEQLGILLTDSSSSVKRAVLHSVSSLCIFLGRQKTNDILLSHTITYLNDKDWLLRHAFFEGVVDVAACVGGKSLEQYILPLMIQALSDSEESVVSKVLAAFTNLAELGLFPRMRVWELMSATLAFLYHPNIWVRQGAASFIASSTKHLPPTDTWAILYPSLKHYLRSDVTDITETHLLGFLKPFLSRHIFDAAISWAAKAGDTQFWKLVPPKGRINEAKETMIANRKSGPTTRHGISKSEEDELHFARLRQMGMTSADESKLISMREYIIKHASAMTSASSRIKQDSGSEKLATTATLELQKLGVIPRTVFLGSRPSEPNARRFKLSDVAIRSPHLATSRGGSVYSASPRLTPSERSSSHAVEDLRRQLAVMNASITSTSRDRRDSATPSDLPYTSPLIPIPLPAVVPPTETLPEEKVISVRPLSPTISTQSTIESSFLRHRVRGPLGVIENHKAAPAIASTKTNALGLLEQGVSLRSASSTAAPSSRPSSPVSNAGTVRAEQNTLRLPSQTHTTQGLLEKLVQEHDSSHDASQDFGPYIRDGPLRRRNNVRQTFAQRHQYDLRDGCQLIATLVSHSAAINGIAISTDHVFFVSCSDDKTVKVWDTARLERNVTSKPRQVYAHKARVTAICTLEKLHCFASASENGQINVIRVPLTQGGSTPKYGKLKVVREHQLSHPGEYATCLYHYFAENSSNLVYATTRGTVAILELGKNTLFRSMVQPPHFGPITCLCIDQKQTWLVTGTLNGTLTLWDIRFGILLKSWKIALPGGGITQCAVHPSKGHNKWIMAAVHLREGSQPVSGGSFIEVWDVEEGRLVESFASGSSAQEGDAPEFPNQSTSRSPLLSMNSTPADAIAELVNSLSRAESTPPDPHSAHLESPFLHPEGDFTRSTRTISCFLSGTDLYGGANSGVDALEINLGMTVDDFSLPTSSKERGFLLTGSHDCKVRLWDLEQVERSKLICGADAEEDQPIFKGVQNNSLQTKLYLETWSPPRQKRPRPRTTILASHQQELIKAHQDTITAIGCLQSPFRGGIITGDSSGVLKVWRLETI